MKINPILESEQTQIVCRRYERWQMTTRVRVFYSAARYRRWSEAVYSVFSVCSVVMPRSTTTEHTEKTEYTEKENIESRDRYRTVVLLAPRARLSISRRVADEPSPADDIANTPLAAARSIDV